MTSPSLKVANKKSFKDWQYSVTAHIRDPENVAIPDGLEERRMKIYNDLFFNNIDSFITDSFPVLRTLYNDEDWLAMTRSFFIKHQCHTPLFLEIAQEFISYLQNEHEMRECDFPFMLELAHYEWVELALSIDESEIEPGTVNTDGDLLDGHPFISPLAWPLSYQFEVHKIGADYLPEEGAAQGTHLIVYRDNEDDVCFMEINPVTARLLALLNENEDFSGREALQQIATELQHPSADAVIEGGLSTLKELQKRQIILGTKR